MESSIKRPKELNMYHHIGIALLGIAIIMTFYVGEPGVVVTSRYSSIVIGVYYAAIVCLIEGSYHFKELKKEFTCPKMVIKIYNDYGTFPNIDDGIAKYFNDNGFHEISEHSKICSNREFEIFNFIREQPDWMHEDYKSFYRRTFSTENAFEFRFIEKVADGNGCILEYVVDTYTCDCNTLRKKYKEVRGMDV